MGIAFKTIPLQFDVPDELRPKKKRRRVSVGAELKAVLGGKSALCVAMKMQFYPALHNRRFCI
jgi:hypothetical protein